MAHFAQLDATNTVVQVIVVENRVVGETFPDSEPVGQSFISDVLQLPGQWVQTSYNGNFRGKYAAIGDTWDGTNFISPETNNIS